MPLVLSCTCGHFMTVSFNACAHAFLGLAGINQHGQLLASGQLVQVKLGFYIVHGASDSAQVQMMIAHSVTSPCLISWSQSGCRLVPRSTRPESIHFDRDRS